MDQTTFKRGDYVVFRRDVCKVIRIAKSDMTGENCYILVPYKQQDGSVKIQVPVSNRGGHLRSLISKEDIYALIANTPNIQTLENKPANMKSQYAALLKSDSLEDLICIIKTGYARNEERLANHKKLASVDEEYMKKAERYLYDEISVALGLSFDESKVFFETEVQKAAMSRI